MLRATHVGSDSAMIALGRGNWYRATAVTVSKVFAHGLVLTSFSVFVGLVVFPALLEGLRVIFLASQGSAIVFVVGLLSIGGVLVVLNGLVNSQLVRWIWFPLSRGLLSFLVQGIALSIVSSIVLVVPVVILIGLATILASSESLALLFALVILESFVYGYLGREIARPWQINRPRPAIPRPPTQPNNPKGLHCPRCDGIRLIVAEDKSAYCIDCERGIQKENFGASGA